MFIIRIAEKKDVPAILACYAPYVKETAITFEYVVPDESVYMNFFCEVSQNYPWLVLCDDEVVVGYAYANRVFAREAYQWGVVISIYISCNYYGRGLGRGLFLALLPLLTKQGVYTAYSVITLPNDASMRLHEYFGFCTIGHFKDTGFKLGRWHDVVWMEKKLHLATDAPYPIIPLNGLEKNEIQSILADAERYIR